MSIKFPIYTGAVSAGTLVSITISPSSSDIMVTGVVSFAAIGTYGDLSTADITSSVVWDSSDINVSTVVSGIATGVGYGQATISATLDSVVGTAILTVEIPQIIIISM